MQLLFGGGGGGGRRHPIYYVFISNNSGCKWVKYSISRCQPCQNSFIWTYFPIAYTNKVKLSVLNHFLNMANLISYRIEISTYVMIYSISFLLGKSTNTNLVKKDAVFQNRAIHLSFEKNDRRTDVFCLVNKWTNCMRSYTARLYPVVNIASRALYQHSGVKENPRNII